MVITWDSHTQTTKTLLNYRVAWTPEGEGFKSADRTNWNVHTTGTQHTVTGLDAGATYQVKVRTRYEGHQGSRWTDVVTATAAENSAQSDEEPEPDRARGHQPIPNMNINGSSGFEESSFGISFTVTLSALATHDVTFTWVTSIESGDTAEAGDFTPVAAGSGVINTGQEGTSFTVDPIDDALYEGVETFTVTISDATNANISSGVATGTINEFETQPTLSIAAASATEGDDIEFTVDLIGHQTEEDVTFYYITTIASGDNSGHEDFTATSGTGTITSGSSSTTITVPTDVDSVYEDDETFTVTISNPTVAVISQATAKGTILN